MFSQARFILSKDSTFQEKGSETNIKYHEDFDEYKCVIIENIESPGMISTFARLNFEILGTLSPALSSSNNQAKDLHVEDERARLRAELWEEPSAPLLIYF